MTSKIKLDIISDVVCPWCIIGYNRVSKAISELELQDRVEIEWHPFQLNPDMPVEGEDAHAHMSRKYGMNQEDIRGTFAQMTALGAEVGFTFDFFDSFKMVNTSDLHILLDFAKESGKQTDLKMRLFKACFSERKNVSDRRILAQELQSVGLNVNEGLARLADQKIREKVRIHEAHWKGLGVSGVPTMIFNNSDTFTGAQPINIYKQVLSSCLENEPLKALFPGELAG
ncbi:MAG: putative DsbA family dithiol-disulfide isomerase [Desulforhopalus sp.]|jgi:predicted DsbA family dithiol-disulfide isomerase